MPLVCTLLILPNEFLKHILLQSPQPGTEALYGNSLELLQEVLARVLWEIGFSGKCSRGCSGRLGVLHGVLQRLLKGGGLNRKSALGGTPEAPPNPGMTGLTPGPESRSNYSPQNSA